MNIFMVDSDPVISAKSLVDRHVVKMILESAQLLSTAHRILDGKEILGVSKTGRKVKRWILDDGRENVVYTATHINHPSATWCRKSISNYLWLVEHMYGLMDEYKYRYEKTHKVSSSGLAYVLQSPPFNLKEFDLTVAPSAMDKSYIVSDNPIVNYRNYYKNGKKHLHNWSRREKPDWI